MKYFLIGCIGILLNATSIFAQDANYWSSPYGPGAFFTPGSVISFNGDSGVLFANPALLAYSKNNAASISGTLYQREAFKIKDGAGTSLDLKSTRGSIVPLIASHSIPFKIKLPFTLVYAIIHRPIISFNASQRKEAVQNVLDDAYSPGAETFIGQYSLTSLASETSGILSAGFKLNKKWALGFTTEGMIHKLDYVLDYKSRAIHNADPSVPLPPISAVQEYYQANSRNTGIRLKAGLSYIPNSVHHFGLLVTSPLVHVKGSSSILADNQINDLKVGGGSDVNLLANTRQSNLKSKWKMPLSVGAGYTYFHRKGQLYFSGEYFSEVDEYNVITPRNEAFIRPDTGMNIYTSAFLKLKDVRKSVFNFSVGASYQLKERMTAYFSLRTDFTYADGNLYADDYGYEVNITNINNYHTQIGVNLQKLRYNLRAGILLRYGHTKDYMQGINFDDPNENNLLIGEVHKTSASHLSMGFLFSYIYNF